MKKFQLDNQPKIKSGFTVPDHYFEEVCSKVLDQLPSNESKVVNLQPVNNKKWIGIAASIVIVLGISLTWWYQSRTVAIPTETIENYLTYQSSITQYELINNLTKEDLISLNENLPLNTVELEEHLLKETDVEQLIIE